MYFDSSNLMFKLRSCLFYFFASSSRLAPLSLSWTCTHAFDLHTFDFACFYVLSLPLSFFHSFSRSCFAIFKFCFCYLFVRISFYFKLTWSSCSISQFKDKQIICACSCVNICVAVILLHRWLVEGRQADALKVFSYICPELKLTWFSSSSRLRSVIHMRCMQLA